MIILGINTSGIPHYGNWISLIKPILNYNKKILFLADLHSISKNKSYNNIIFNKIIINFVFKSFFVYSCYYQSCNKNIIKLFWIISCFYKINKIKFLHNLKKNYFLNFGSISYPLLMCSDIFFFKKKIILLGYDQIQHLELYKKIKNKINFYLNYNFFKNNYFIINNITLYSFNKKKMSKSNNNDIFIYSNFIKIKKFFFKFKLTLKRKKSIFNFFLNFFKIKNFYNFFFLKYKKIINIFSEIIYYKFLKNKIMFLNLFKKKNILFSFLNKNNIFFNNINNNFFNLFKKNINF